MKTIQLIVIIIASFYFSGCTNKIQISPKKPFVNKELSKDVKQDNAPKYFYVRVAIKNWKTVPGQNKILYDAEEKLGHVEVEGRYIYLNDVVLKLIASNYPQYYWVMKLPNFKEGIFTLKAIRRNDPFYLEKADSTPPTQLNLIIVLKNKKIIDHYLENVRPWWGYFDFYKIDKINKKLYFKNSKYPNCLWACKYPTVDGTYKLDIRLIEKD